MSAKIQASEFPLPRFRDIFVIFFRRPFSEQHDAEIVFPHILKSLSTEDSSFLTPRSASRLFSPFQLRRHGGNLLLRHFLGFESNCHTSHFLRIVSLLSFSVS
jgi:hypothetical protein